MDTQTDAPQQRSPLKNTGVFSLENDATSVQFPHLSNQTTHRQLSRVTASSRAMPVWKQQSHGTQATPTEDFSPYIPQKPKNIATHNTPTTVVKEEGLPQREPVSTLPTGVKQAPTETKVVEKEIPLTPKNTYPESSPKPLESPETESAPVIPQPTVPEGENQQLSQSIKEIAALQQRILAEEHAATPFSTSRTSLTEKKKDLDLDKRTKEALLQNAKQALSNTKQELDILRSDPTTSTGTLRPLETEYANLEKRIVELEQEHKEVVKKQVNLDQKQQQLTEPATHVPPTADTHLSPSPEMQALLAQRARNEKKQQGTAQPAQPIDIPLPAITIKPNAINGVVVTSSNKLVVDAIVIIKDDRQKPIRALKTNQLGQFWVTTPLENGTYFIETEMDNADFDTVEISLTGGVVHPIKIMAH